MFKKLIWIIIIPTLLLAACQEEQAIPQPTVGVVSGRICFPSGSIPEMNLFFQPVGNDRVISYPIHEGQEEYSIELAPGTYHAYAWLPGGLFGGGMYSEAVPCGLAEDCSHGLLPVEVVPGEETNGVDICDWYAEPDQIPLPPGLVENLIVNFWQEEHPEFSPEESLSLEELTMDGQIVPQLGVRIFHVTEGLLENETFLITHPSSVLRLGAATGGRGVSSLALSDLDGDGTSELYYSYSFGSGIQQSRLGVYAPAHAAGKVYEAEATFLSDLGLFSDQPGQVGVRAVEGDPETMTISYLDTLGYLGLGRADGELQLVFNQVDDLSEDLQDKIVLPEASAEDAGNLWRTVEDTHHGVRFAVPCFWEVGILESPPPTDAYAYPIRNYTDAYTNSLGKDKSSLWEGGGIKIDMNFLSGSNWNLNQDDTADDLLGVLFDEGSTGTLLGREEVVVNGQTGLLITAESSFGEVYRYYLFKLPGKLFLMFGPRPGTLEHPDVQGILHSLALTPDAQVKIPGIVPQDPMDGITDTCLEERQ
jgi:hypothetical protein